jgi:hypothetical protein
MLPLAFMIPANEYELAVHQRNFGDMPRFERSELTFSKKDNGGSHRQSFDHNQTVNNEPPSGQLFRNMNIIETINQEASSS